MKNSYKILQILLTILLCVLFGFVTYFALNDKVAKADTNLNLVNFQYSDNWSTSGMPDYNRFILNSTPFYNDNTSRGITYDYKFSFDSFKPQDDPRRFVLFDYFDYTFSNSSQAESVYNYFDSLTPMSSPIIRFNYYNNFSLWAYVFYVPELYNSTHVVLRVCAQVQDISLSPSVDNVYFDVSLNSNNNNRYDFIVHNIPLGVTYPNIYIGYNINHPYYTNGVSYIDCWGFSSLREDYFTINYDVFSYYYFNYGDINFVQNTCFWKGNYIDLVFKSSNIDNIIATPNISSDHVGWHADTGVILTRFDFNTNGNWLSYRNTDFGDFFCQLSFDYYVDQNLVNSYNGSNSNYDSTYLYRQDVQWYDIFGHLYNFMIYLLFDMPLISNITKPIYMLISGTTTTFNWLTGIVSSLGIFGAFAMCYLLFAIIKRFL